MSWLSNISKLGLVAFAIFLSSSLTASQGVNARDLPKPSDWPRHGQDFTNSQFNPFSLLTKQKANKIHERCRINYVRGQITTGLVESTSSQPIIVNDVVYWTGFAGQVGATKLIRDKKGQVTNCEDLWVKDVSDELGLNVTTTEPAVRVSPAYFIDKRGKPALLYLGIASGFTLPSPLVALQTPFYAFALDAKTGNKLFQVPIGDPGSIVPANAFANATSSPMVYNQVAYFGLSSFNNLYSAPNFGGFPITFRGQIVALDLLGIGNSGVPFVKWKQYTVPAKPNNHTGPWFTGGGVWASGASVVPLAGKEKKGLLITGSGQLYTYPNFVGECMSEDLPSPIQFGSFSATKRGEIGSGLRECYERAEQTLAQMGINEPIASNSVIALNMKDGSYAWHYPTVGIDAWQVFCGSQSGPGGTPNCSVPIAGPDWDVGGSAPIVTIVDSKPTVISHHKGGAVFVLDALTGAKRLALDVCVGSTSGGIQWGLSYDPLRKQILAPCVGANPGLGGVVNKYRSVLADGRVVCQGYLNAIDVKTGQLKWQAVPAQSDTQDPACPTEDYVPDQRFKYGVDFDHVLKNQMASVPVVQMPRSDNIPNQTPLSTRIHTPPTITSNMIFMPSYAGVVYLLDANNGAYLNQLFCDRGALYQGLAVTSDVAAFGCGYSLLGLPSRPSDAGNNIMIYSLDK